jgi:hypothetical protein
MTLNIRALLVYILICLFTFTIGALVIELGVIPLVASFHGYKTYYLQTLSRIYAWYKFVTFAAIVCGLGGVAIRQEQLWSLDDDLDCDAAIGIDLYMHQLHPDERMWACDNADSIVPDKSEFCRATK